MRIWLLSVFTILNNSVHTTNNKNKHKIMAYTFLAITKKLDIVNANVYYKFYSPYLFKFIIINFGKNKKKVFWNWFPWEKKSHKFLRAHNSHVCFLGTEPSCYNPGTSSVWKKRVAIGQPYRHSCVRTTGREAWNGRTTENQTQLQCNVSVHPKILYMFN